MHKRIQNQDPVFTSMRIQTVVDPDPDLVGSDTFTRILIRILNEFEVKN